MRNVVIMGSLMLAACGGQPDRSEAANGIVGNSLSPSAELQIDARQLLGTSKTRVREVLGEPRSCRREGRGESCAYGRPARPGDATEIFYVDARAARLTLPNYGLAYQPESLSAYGLTAGEPVFRNEHVIRWRTTLGSIPTEIDMFPSGDGRIFYLYVIAENVEL
jgi:hypothetical protein